MSDFQEHLDFIKGLKQHEQKSEAWLNQRRGKLTSSDAATALGINPYKKPVQLLLEKCGTGKSFTGNEATKHGEKYEDEAIEKYCYLMGKKNHTVGMISFGDLDPIRLKSERSRKYADPRYHFLGGSADGISEDNDGIERLVMLEAKCPMRRKIKHGQIPIYYYPQVQLNMFILDLEIADFIEYIPGVYGKNTEMNIVRIHRDEEWFDKNFPVLEEFWNSVLAWRQRDIRMHPAYKMDHVVSSTLLSAPDFLFISTNEGRPPTSSSSSSSSLLNEDSDDCMFD